MKGLSLTAPSPCKEHDGARYVVHRRHVQHRGGFVKRIAAQGSTKLDTPGEVAVEEVAHVALASARVVADERGTEEGRGNTLLRGGLEELLTDVLRCHIPVCKCVRACMRAHVCVCVCVCVVHVRVKTRGFGGRATTAAALLGGTAARTHPEAERTASSGKVSCSQPPVGTVLTVDTKCTGFKWWVVARRNTSCVACTLVARICA